MGRQGKTERDSICACLCNSEVSEELDIGLLECEVQHSLCILFKAKNSSEEVRPAFSPRKCPSYQTVKAGSELFSFFHLFFYFVYTLIIVFLFVQLRVSFLV